MIMITSSNSFQNKVTVFAGPTAKTIERTIIRTDSLSENLGMSEK